MTGPRKTDVELRVERIDSAVGAPLVQALLDELWERYGGPDPDHPAPGELAPPDGVFLVAFVDGIPVGSGGLRRHHGEPEPSAREAGIPPSSEARPERTGSEAAESGTSVGEIKRMYVASNARRRGVGRAVLRAIELRARAMGYARLVLETGVRQPEAIALYESEGYQAIEPYGVYRDAPMSRCFAKDISTSAADAGSVNAADTLERPRRREEKPMSEPPATLRYGERELELPSLVGTEGERALDISKLRAQSGYVTLDYGFVNTASCESAITFIDGEAGILRYRGIDIEELVSVPSPSFLESSYLLIYGELPTKQQLDDFRFGIRKHTLVHEDVKRFFDGFPKDAHPMATLSSTVTALSTFYQDSLDPKDPQEAQLSIIRLMAKLPTIAAYAYKKSIGQPYIYPDNRLDLIENFLTMMFAVPSEHYEVSHTVVNALKKCLILHADHEQNCSTSTVRLVGSSEVNIYAAIAAGINALWGPLHGGANQMVIEMLENIHADGDDVDKYVKMAKDPSNPFRLSGFGHRVYKNYDPRARILKDACDDVLTELDRRDHLLDLALELEKVALNDEYFVERKLYPNVDFYSGLIYRAMGFPTRMFTVLFAIGRLPGWLAQWKEMMEDPATKIGRPRQIYVGPTKRPYVPIDERG